MLLSHSKKKAFRESAIVVLMKRLSRVSVFIIHLRPVGFSNECKRCSNMQFRLSGKEFISQQLQISIQYSIIACIQNTPYVFIKFRRNKTSEKYKKCVLHAEPRCVCIFRLNAKQRKYKNLFTGEV